MSNAREQSGFTVIEVVIAAAVLMIGVLGTLALIDRANATTVTTRSREAATNLARELVEAARSVPYPSLTPGAIEGEMQALPGLADDDGTAGWTIERRGFIYTVTVTVCAFDDARDGGGNQSAGNFCPDSAAGTEDTNPEDYRRVRVDVRWTHNGVARDVHQTELINNPGSAGAPAVRTLTLDPPPTNRQVTHTAPPHTLAFRLTTSSRPETLHWLLDGSSQGPITDGADRAWRFEWPVGDPATGIVDGTYVVSAEAFDRYGVAGPSRSYTVELNRNLPDTVAFQGGGRNGAIVELEWLPSRQRDILGYTVERWDGAAWALVQERSKATSLIDRQPPAGELHYRVFAWDTGPDGQPRPSPVPAEWTVQPDYSPPAPPLNVTAAPAADGGVRLTWARPNDATVAFYRIYRDGDRYAVWESGEAGLTYVDGRTGGIPHSYAVTAVNEDYAESPPVPAEWAP